MPDYSQVQPYSLLSRMPMVPESSAESDIAYEQLASIRQQRQAIKAEADKQAKAQALISIYTDADNNFDRNGYINALRMIDATMADQAEKHFLEKDKETAEMMRVLDEAAIRKIEIANKRISQGMYELTYIAELLDRARKAYSLNDKLAGDAWYSEALRDSKLIQYVGPNGETVQGIDLPEQYDTRVHDIIAGKAEIMQSLVARLSGQNIRFASQAGSGDSEYIKQVKEQIARSSLSDESKNTLLLLAEQRPAEAIQRLYAANLPKEQKQKSLEVDIERKEKEAEITKESRLDIERNIEKMKREYRQKYPQLSTAESEKISKCVLGVQAATTLRQMLEKGNVDYFATGKAGEFTNPEANLAFRLLVEVHGREQSGAAINESEWKSFAAQLFNKQYLLTESGRKTLIENLINFEKKFLAVGIDMGLGEDWYQKRKERVDKAFESYQESGGEAKNTPKSLEDYLKEVREILNKK